VDRAPFEVAAVEFRVGAVLLDHEDVDPQLQQRVQTLRGELDDRRAPDRAVHGNAI
jgi:hypothetical protein